MPRSGGAAHDYSSSAALDSSSLKDNTRDCSVSRMTHNNLSASNCRFIQSNRSQSPFTCIRTCTASDPFPAMWVESTDRQPTLHYYNANEVAFFPIESMERPNFPDSSKCADRHQYGKLLCSASSFGSFDRHTNTRDRGGLHT